MASNADLVMPKLGLTMTEGRLAEWRVKVGDKVAPGDTLFVVETDKIANEVDAPTAGEIQEILVAEGETVPVGAVLARWTGVGISHECKTISVESESPSPAPTERRQSAATRLVSTPLARRLARQHAVDLSAVRGTGPKGRIKAEDISRALGEITITASGSSRAVPSAKAPASTSPTPVAQRRKPNHAETVAAQRLAETTREVPHFYLSTTADVTRLLRLREDMRLDSLSPPTMTHFVLCAVARALGDLPWANSIWLADEILAFDRVDIALAIDTPQGLLAPVLRDVGRMGFDDVVRAAKSLVERARTSKLTIDDFGGGAIAISNLGMHDIDLVLPIINAPQAAILGIGRIRSAFRPDAQGAPTASREMALVLSCDHRILDGVKAAKLLQCIVSYLQHPGRLMSAAAKAGI